MHAIIYEENDCHVKITTRFCELQQCVTNKGILSFNGPNYVLLS